MDRNRHLTRRGFLAGSAAAAGVGLYSYGPARHHISLIKHDVYVSNLPAPFHGFTIAQLSDFHFGPYDEDPVMRGAIAAVNSLKPSLVALTGDFITADHDNNMNNLSNAKRAAEMLKGIHCPLRYASLGNHDVVDTEGVTEALKDSGITVLRNQYLSLDLRGSRIWLAGVADYMFDHPHLEVTLPPATPDQPVILLGHEPDFADILTAYCQQTKRRTDLFLTGHTHGGQINIPLFTRIMMPIHGQKYVQGPFQLGSTLLYVNRGLGTIHLPMRLFCPPEVTLFTLHPNG